MSFKIDWRGPAIFGGIIFIMCLPAIGKYSSKSSDSVPSQHDSFRKDIAKSNSYWVHNNRAWNLKKEGLLNEAAQEYQKAIEVIGMLPDEFVRTDVSAEYRERVNRELRNSRQIFSRYGLIEVFDRAGRYEEAVAHVEWLQQNQIMKGKEEFLKNKLAKMKADLQAKLNGQI